MTNDTPAQASVETVRGIIAWLRANASAEKEPKAKAALIEAYNAALTIRDMLPPATEAAPPQPVQGVEAVAIRLNEILRDALTEEPHLAYHMARGISLRLAQAALLTTAAEPVAWLAPQSNEVTVERDHADYWRTTLGREVQALGVIAAPPAPAPEAGELCAHPRVSSPDWQPIETAPKDGTWVLLTTAGQHPPFVGMWYQNGWDDGDFHSGMTGMTHWMPLPPPPQGDLPEHADAHSKPQHGKGGNGEPV